MQVAFARTDPHVQDVGQRDRVEAGPQFPGDGAREKGLAASRRSVQQEATRKATAVKTTHFRITHRDEEGRLQAPFHFLQPADIRQGHVRTLAPVIRTQTIRRPGKDGKRLGVAGITFQSGGAVRERGRRIPLIDEQVRDMNAERHVVWAVLHRREKTP